MIRKKEGKMSKRRIFVNLTSTLGTGSFYTVKVLKIRKKPLSLKKFDFKARKRAVFVEKKIK